MVQLLAFWLAQTTQQRPGGSPIPFMGLLIAMVVFLFVMQRSARKNEAKRRKQLLESLNKNDRVLTHGGIIGTIVTVKDNEVVLKVDESTNTKMTFIKDAVRQVITDPSDLPTDATPKR
jgi:preprotein translocase subunit YajC